MSCSSYFLSLIRWKLLVLLSHKELTSTDPNQKLYEYKTFLQNNHYYEVWSSLLYQWYIQHNIYWWIYYIICSRNSSRFLYDDIHINFLNTEDLMMLKLALPPDSYRDELWHLLFGLQIYISNLSKQNFILKKTFSKPMLMFCLNSVCQ